MNANRTPDRLERALRELPRMEAPPGFTETVVARLDCGVGRQAARDRRRQPALAWTLASVAVVLGLAAVILVPRLDPLPGDRTAGADAAGPAIAERAGRLREEHRRLREELEALRALVDENPPLLYLGGDERVDLVFDFLPAADARGSGQARPALASSAEEAR